MRDLMAGKPGAGVPDTAQKGRFEHIECGMAPGFVVSAAERTLAASRAINLAMCEIRG
jgi:hypothetical protein